MPATARVPISVCHLLAALTWLMSFGLPASATRAEGLLRVHATNPRYFTDDTNRAIYLAGHQWFNDLQHHAWNYPVSVNWDGYLDFMRERNMNYLRNWIVWSVGDPTSDRRLPLMPFRRTGPGNALDGSPKFDLFQHDPEFFERLGRQLAAAQQRGVYVSIMLFEVYGFMDRDGSYPKSLWAGNVLHGPNNINDIDVDANRDGHGLEFFFTNDERIVSIQRAYVRRVIDTVNRFDNVFYEIANELEARRWQYEMAQFIKQYEATKPKQHLVYISPGGRNREGKWSLLPKKDLLHSSADVYSVARGWNNDYRGNPPTEAGIKPVFMDMDHVAAGDRDGDNDWNNNPTTPWKLLTRGYHQCMYDHDYWKPGENRLAWDATRYNVGAAAQYADRMDLANMHPRNDLASTTYCLANPGHEYLIFSPGTEEFTVKGLLSGRRYKVQWYPTSTRRIAPRDRFRATAAVHGIQPPFHNAVLHLVLDDHGPAASGSDS